MNDYTLRELECFLAVSEELSFTRGARRLRLAQPPLSRHVRSLEEKLGVALLERSKRRVELTPAGQAFRTEARDILPALRRAAEAARRAARGETGRIEVGFVSAVLSPELVEVFTRFGRLRPDIRLQLHDLLPAEQLAALARRELDLAFVGVAPERLPAGLAATPWREEDLLAFVPPNHPFAGRDELRLVELSGEPMVTISGEAAPAYDSMLHALCLAEGFQPRIVREAQRAQAVAALTVAGAGLAVLPASLHRITGNGIPLRRGRRSRCRIAHSVLHATVPEASAKCFLEMLKGRL
jgi:DNA-binding transcriptional LysR family regulator